jgi:hypothetical protein
VNFVTQLNKKRSAHDIIADKQECHFPLPATATHHFCLKIWAIFERLKLVFLGKKVHKSRISMKHP